VQTALTAETKPTPPPFCASISSNLWIGKSGADVTALQTALQKNGVNVAITGIFDIQTKIAAIAFQEKYTKEILVPVGLTIGTGFVGPSTRAKLNNLFSCVPKTPLLPQLPFCGQPPMPVCSEGLACAQVMPQPKTYTDYESYKADKASFLYDKACLGGPLYPSATAEVKTVVATSTAGTLDYNNDKQVDQTDTQFLLDVAIGSRACPVGRVCDLNKDGREAASDALVLANYIGSTAKGGQYDYNDDYKINAIDVALLEKVVAGTMACTEGKVCDLSGGNGVTRQDLQMLSAFVGN